MDLVKGVNFYGPRSDYVVSGSDCGFVYVWDKKTEAIVQRKRGDTSGSVRLMFLPWKLYFLSYFLLLG